MATKQNRAIETGKSKRQMIREQRARKQRQQRTALIIGITVVAVLIAAVLIIPSILEARRPVGEITLITPEARPQANGRQAGNPDAPVTIEVFEDFQCPACQAYSQQIEPLLMKNEVASGQVLYIFRHFPFIDDRSVTKESDQAANASMCAGEQGKFWEYHDMVYANWDGENQGAYTDKRLVAFAEALGLDMTKFNTCFKADTYQDEIKKDLDLVAQLGINQTPTILVNGTRVEPSYEKIQAAIAAAQQ